MNAREVWQYLSTQGAELGIKRVTAIVAWVVGRWPIGLAATLIGKVIERGGKIDGTLARYLK